MKLLVNTTGPFQVYSPAPEQFAQAHRPSVITTSTFMDIAFAANKLVILGQVNDDATDDEFVAYFKDSQGDEDLAVAAFLSAFPVEGEAIEDPKPETAAEKKARLKAEREAAEAAEAAEKADAKE